MNDTTAKTSTGISRILGNLSIRIEQLIVRHERLFLLLILAVFVLDAAYHACTLPLSFDEFFTLFISRLSSTAEMLKAMPADGQPPLQYILTHFSLRLLGGTEFALRLPELLAYLATGLLSFRIVRRHGTAIQALFALALLLGTILVFTAAHTARPYGLLLAFTALSFASWQAATARENHRFFPLCCVALGIGGAICSHHLGIFHVGLFLAAGECVRFIRRKRLDGWMLAAIGAGVSPLAFTLILAHQSRLILGQAVLHSTNFWAKPSLEDLFLFFWMTAMPLLGLIALLMFLPWPHHDPADDAGTLPMVPTYEWAAAGALCLLLPVLLLISTLQTGYFLARYAIGTSLGLALLGGWALPRLDRLRTIGQAIFSLSTLCFVLIVAAMLLWMQIRNPVWNAKPGSEAISPLLLNAPSGLPIVVANAFDYAPEWWYTPPSLKQRLTYLSDIQYAEQQTDFLPELSLDADQAFIPIQVTDYSAFISSHVHFLLLRSGRSRLNWIESRLTSANWHLTPIATSGEDVLYQVDKP